MYGLKVRGIGNGRGDLQGLAQGTTLLLGIHITGTCKMDP